jgi:hypothetical protein
MNFINASNNNKIQTIVGFNHTDIHVGPLAFVKNTVQTKFNTMQKKIRLGKLYSKLIKDTLLRVDSVKAVPNRRWGKTNNIYIDSSVLNM